MLPIKYPLFTLLSKISFAARKSRISRVKITEYLAKERPGISPCLRFPIYGFDLLMQLWIYPTV